MILVSLEPMEWHSWPAEHCIFCNEKTRYWYVPKNEPCCPSCAAVKSPEHFNKGIINRDEWR